MNVNLGLIDESKVKGSLDFSNANGNKITGASTTKAGASNKIPPTLRTRTKLASVAIDTNNSTWDDDGSQVFIYELKNPLISKNFSQIGANDLKKLFSDEIRSLAQKIGGSKFYLLTILDNKYELPTAFVVYLNDKKPYFIATAPKSNYISTDSDANINPDSAFVKKGFKPTSIPNIYLIPADKVLKKSNAANVKLNGVVVLTTVYAEKNKKTGKFEPKVSKKSIEIPVTLTESGDLKNYGLGFGIFRDASSVAPIKISDIISSYDFGNSEPSKEVLRKSKWLPHQTNNIFIDEVNDFVNNTLRPLSVIQTEYNNPKNNIFLKGRSKQDYEKDKLAWAAYLKKGGKPNLNKEISWSETILSGYMPFIVGKAVKDFFSGAEGSPLDLVTDAEEEEESDVEVSKISADDKILGIPKTIFYIGAGILVAGIGYIVYRKMKK